MDFEKLKRGLLALLTHAHAEELRMVENLSDAERETVGGGSGWSAKDVVAHLAAWKRLAALTLQAASRGSDLPRAEDTDAFNSRVMGEWRGRSWHDVLVEAERNVADLVSSVNEATATVFTDASRFEWKKGKPLWKLVMCDGFEHPIGHAVRFHARGGNLAAATEVQLRAVEALIRHFHDPEYLGYAQYDLGCLRLQAGEREGALSAIRAAFHLNPELIVESRDDAELESIRAELG